MTQNTKLGKYVAIRTLETNQKHMLPIARGSVVEVEQTSTNRLLAVSGSAIWKITKSDISGGGALLHHTYAAQEAS
jgi:hypothetical protein